MTFSATKGKDGVHTYTDYARRKTFDCSVDELDPPIYMDLIMKNFRQGLRICQGSRVGRRWWVGIGPQPRLHEGNAYQACRLV